MANTYSWQINALDTYPSKDGLSNVVYNIHYTFKGESEQVNDDGATYKADMIGTHSIEAPNADAFTDFESLTESQVVGWLESGLDVQEFKNAIDGIISEQIQPSTITKSTPW